MLLEMVERHPHFGEFDVDAICDLSILRQRLVADDIDILLMDIKLEGAKTDGIEFVRKYSSPQSGMQTIFVTGYDSYHSSAHRTPHVGFLLKPVSQDALEEAVSAAMAKVATYRERPFWVRTSTGERVIDPRRLFYAESDRRIVRLHVNGSVVETYGKLSDLLERLPDRFVQCHKSYVVNMGFIDELGRSEITLTSGERIPVSQKRRSAVRAAFFDYIGRGF